MGYKIGKVFSFSASHQLPDLPAEHKCARLHGHNYRVEVTFRADQLVPPGFVTDFGDLAPFKDHLDDKIDHRHLNDVMAHPPTSENLATHLAIWIIDNLEPGIHGTLISVRVHETDSTWAEYSPDRTK
ncbi:6-pyruvoyltetrahydropterin/6-carboxytetrahydropterin synthase [Micromonospora sp. Llam0]|uniref:6-pyruvoyl trahydropterin synthase family protein n=1 Tax=Micromonospora sp. Llam0 TaxID=2485143 RepID=UPI000F49F709|nr:6-carboxytetrahydropterin synthase [Micromonospora sp. Llam0]ROO51615.1 6-pyruvoyltetrahydropterin/6-carboxytetrahydropterin synthase [Micromonospora sp. Llam0]